LKESCQLFALITLRELAQGERLDYAYQVKLKRNETFEDFVAKLQALESIKGVNLLLQESTVEI